AYTCIFSGILHINFLTYVSMPAKFLHNLPKNLTAYLRRNLCAVLPKSNAQFRMGIAFSFKTNTALHL
ncbi:MAG: hypothetical protein J6L99_04990, partial [Ruminococcus sp.]|nr:hypothetical protein [Ruminococcus sp.]